MKLTHDGVTVEKKADGWEITIVGGEEDCHQSMNVLVTPASRFAGKNNSSGERQFALAAYWAEEPNCLGIIVLKTGQAAIGVRVSLATGRPESFGPKDLLEACVPPKNFLRAVSWVPALLT